jgi:hypothetical protein
LLKAQGEAAMKKWLDEMEANRKKEEYEADI